jgi:hypothetical protein
MRLPTKKVASGLNTMTMTGVSLLWGHMLGLINPWWGILTVFCLLIGMGNEIIAKKES